MTTYAYTLPTGETITEGRAFALAVQIPTMARVMDGHGQPAFSEEGQPLYNNVTVEDTLQFPPNWLAHATDDDLARFNITKTVVADPEPSPPTADDYKNAIQAYVDETAQAKNYTDGVSCASYKDSTISSWAAEATAFISWRDQVWAYAFTQLAAVQSGQRTPQPSIDTILSELPTITWPD